MEKRLKFPRLGKLMEETRSRKETWLWDGVIPANDLTLIAAFMKKGKTTLLTGVIKGLLHTGHYCGRSCDGGRKVLYLAPEEGDTLIRRFERLGFTEDDDVTLTVIPRGHQAWAGLISAYRMREWTQVVKELKEDGYDTVVMDGLHTLLMMFEPMAKEDNESVGKFMAGFVLPFGSNFTVVASLHTKKGGGDPKMKVPPEEMIRGASAWMAHPGQILVLDHERKTDTKTFHAFGRYEGTTAGGWAIRYDETARDYVALASPEEEAEEQARIKDDRETAQIEQKVMMLVGLQPWQHGKSALAKAVGMRRARVVQVIDDLVRRGELVTRRVKPPMGAPVDCYGPQNLPAQPAADPVEEAVEAVPILDEEDVEVVDVTQDVS